MNTLMTYLDPIITTLGWTLLHFVWQGALIAAAYAILCWLFDRARASTRYNIGVSMIVLMLVAPVITFMAIYQGPAASAEVASIAASSAVAPASGAPAADWIGALETQAEGLMPWAVLAWFVGVWFSSRRIYQDWRQVRALVCEQVRPLPAHWQQIAREISKAYGIRAAVRVLESGKVAVPMVMGWLKPVILVPSSALFGLSHKQIEMLLAHEFAHVRRLDYLVNLIQVAVETLLFYHPAVRWMSARVRHERELCCDEMVVETSGDRLTYARALAGMEELRGSSTALGMAANGGQLLARIDRLAAAPAPQRGVIHWVVGLAVLGSGVGMFNTAQIAIELDSPAAVQPVALLAAPDPEPVVMVPAAQDEIEPPPMHVDASVTDSVPAAATVAAVAGPVNVPVRVATPAPAVEERSAPEPQTPSESQSVEPAAPAGADEVPVLLAPAALETSAIIASEPEPERVAMIDATPLAPEPLVQEAIVEPEPVVTGGQLISGRQPEFPRKARLRGIEGWVTVRYTVGLDGRVHDLDILESNPGRTFDRSVRRALASWRFEPIVVDGQPVEQKVVRTIQFRMQPGSEKINGCAYATGTRLCRESREPEMEDSLTYQAGAEGQ